MNRWTLPSTYWLILALIGGLASWRWLVPREMPAVKPPATSPVVAVAQVAPDDELAVTAPEVSDDGRQHVFELPLAPEDFAEIQELSCRLELPDEGELLIQAILECDHRHSFSHDLKFRRRPAPEIEFRLTFGNDGGVWQSVGHDGRWSNLEMAAARRLQVKVFSQFPLSSPPTLHCRVHRFPAEVPATLAWSDALRHRLPLGERFELAFDFHHFPGDVFAPDTVALSCLVTRPDGTEVTLTPFVHQDFEAVIGPEREEIRPRGAKHWRVRFRPETTGIHRYLLQIGEQDEVRPLTVGEFTVTPGDPPAFIRLSPDNPRFFISSATGEFFYPIGWNIVYPFDEPYNVKYVPYLPLENSLSAMLKMIDDLADNGGNFCRFWVTDWFSGIEWHRDVDRYGGIGRYNLKNAWLLDQLLEHSRRRGVYFLFETLNHVRLNQGFSWREHPYARANGGFLGHPQEFWTDPRAAAADARRLRHLVACLAGSPALQSWNLMSEPDLVSQRVWPQAKALIFRQLQLAREIDPYRHLTTNHINTHSRDFSFYDAPAIEFIHSNAYPGVNRLHEDQAFAVRKYSEEFASYYKPVMISEYGGHWAADPPEKMRRDILGGLWAGVCSDLSGTPLNWWWNFTYGEDLAREYRTVAAFMRGENLIAEDVEAMGYWRNRPAVAQSRERNLRALMVGNRRRRLAFIFNFDTVCRSRFTPTECRDNRVAFDQMADGAYTVEYWRPGEVAPAFTAALTVANGQGQLQPPPLTHALLAKIVATPDAPPTATAEATANGDDDGTATAAATSDATRDETATATATAAPESAWPEPSWRIVPLLPILAPAATPRTFHQCRIALPQNHFGAFPRLRGRADATVTFTWEFLEHGAGWNITIPGDQAGPFTLSPSTTQETPPAPFDEETAGLLLSISEQRAAPILDPDNFAATFAARTNHRHLRAAQIDLLENPFGNNDHFLTKFAGPLLIPETGGYHFSINSDDGSFLKLNGQVIVEWLGNHVPEGNNRPLYNEWRRRHELTLERGIHHLEYYHQECTGWQMARVGWQPAPMAHDAVLRPCVSAAIMPEAPVWQTIPPVYFDGMIPCSIELFDGNRPLGTVWPAQGLRLRRPGRDIQVIRWQDPEASTATTNYRATPGRTVISGAAGNFPVWAANRRHQPFSLEWEQGQHDDGGHFIKAMLYDISLPLTLRRGDQSATQDVSPRQWILFPLSAEDDGKDFTWCLGETPLQRGTVASWPRPPPLPETPLTNPAFTTLLAPTAAGGAVRLPRQALARWYRGPERGAQLEATPFPVDIWQSPPAEFIAAARAHSGQVGVVLLLDHRPAMLNLDRAEFATRLGDWVTALLAAELTPVLVMARNLDVADPVNRRHAMAFITWRDQLNLPLVDLRFAHEKQP